MSRKPITFTVTNLGKVKDALTGREADGLTVRFGDGPARALSWDSYRKLLKMEMADDATDPAAPPVAHPKGWDSTATPSAVPTAIPAK